MTNGTEGTINFFNLIVLITLLINGFIPLLNKIDSAQIFKMVWKTKKIKTRIEIVVDIGVRTRNKKIVQAKQTGS